VLVWHLGVLLLGGVVGALMGHFSQFRSRLR